MLVTKTNLVKESIGFFKDNSSLAHYTVRGIKWNTKTLDELEELPYEVVLDINMDKVNIYMEAELEEFIEKELTKAFGYSHSGWKTHYRLNEISKHIEDREESRLNHEIERILHSID